MVLLTNSCTSMKVKNSRDPQSWGGAPTLLWALPPGSHDEDSKKIPSWFLWKEEKSNHY